MRPLNNITNNSNNSNNNNDDESNNGNRSHQDYIIDRLTQNGATPVAHIAGKGIIRVVSRCEEAKENNNLDLSQCSLMHVPEAVYHLMRHTELKSCDLSCNVLTKISPKLILKFNFITELNLSHNQIAQLPSEISDLNSLESLDISNNSFLLLPSVVFKMATLKNLNASSNKIIDIDFDLLDMDKNSLELVNLRFNPLTGRCYDILQRATKLSYKIKIELSEKQKEDWEDLNIE